MQQPVVQSPTDLSSEFEIPAVPRAIEQSGATDPSDRLAEALGLSAAAAQRLRLAVSRSNQSPAVAASLLGLAPDDRIASISAQLYDTPLWTMPFDTAAAELVELNPQFLQDRFALPLADDGEGVAIGLVDPGDKEAREGLAFALGDKVAFFTIPLSLWRQVHGDKPVVDAGGLPISEAPGRSEHLWADDAERLKDFERDAPIVRVVDRLFERAVLASASDIHVEQKSDHALVRLRIDGELREGEQIPADLGPALIARVKVLADLDVASRRAPQDGRTTVSVRGEPIDLRVSTTPTAYGESLVVRLLHRRAVSFELDDLGFSPVISEQLGHMLRRPHGLLLVTGPTGSGKTTTLYAALKRLVSRSLKILTIEDPIEYLFEDINQTQVNEAAGVTFASALRSFLRHDPDVILVGEIRDSETARLAVQAALTGHLVLATLHTNDAPSAAARLVDMGVERYLLAGVLLGVIAQRLAPALCRYCHPVSSLSEAQPLLAHACHACGGTGKAGRAVLGEIFEVDDEVEHLLSEGAPTGQLRKFLKAQKGFQTLRDDALVKVGKGEVAQEDAMRITAA